MERRGRIQKGSLETGHQIRESEELRITQRFLANVIGELRIPLIIVGSCNSFIERRLQLVRGKRDSGVQILSLELVMLSLLPVRLPCRSVFLNLDTTDILGQIIFCCGELPCVLQGATLCIVGCLVIPLASTH